MIRALLVSTVLCALAGGAAAAGPIYRCGPDGRVFSQTPCAGGTVVETTAPPSEERQAEARRVAEQDRRLADDMERTRRAEEAARTPKQAAALTQPKRKADPRGGDEPAHKPRLFRPSKKAPKKTQKASGAVVLRPAGTRQAF